jgi:hypothetical protein
LHLHEPEIKPQVLAKQKEKQVSKSEQGTSKSMDSQWLEKMKRKKIEL